MSKLKKAYAPAEQYLIAVSLAVMMVGLVSIAMIAGFALPTIALMLLGVPQFLSKILVVAGYFALGWFYYSKAKRDKSGE